MPWCPASRRTAGGSRAARILPLKALRGGVCGVAMPITWPHARGRSPMPDFTPPAPQSRARAAAGPVQVFLSPRRPEAPGGTLTSEFWVVREFFGEADDAATEQKAKAFAGEHHCTFRYNAEQGLGIFKRVGPPRG